MDAEVAEVAQATFDDVPVGLLDELFQFVDFRKLLTIRRVCRNWRESLQFVRSVGIPVDAFGEHYLANMDAVNDFWRFAKSTRVMLIFGNAESDAAGQSHTWTIKDIWKLYEGQVAADDRASRIQKVVYANVTFDSDVFQSPATRRVGFQTVLFNVTLKISAHEIFGINISDVSNIDSEVGFATVYLLHSAAGAALTVEVPGRDSFVTPPTDQIATSSSYGQIFPHCIPVSTYFALRHAKPLKLDKFRYSTLVGKLAWLRDIEVFDACLYFVGQLVERIDPDARNALDLFKTGDLDGFLGAAHPVISTLFCHGLDPLGHADTRS